MADLSYCAWVFNSVSCPTNFCTCGIYNIFTCGTFLTHANSYSTRFYLTENFFKIALTGITTFFKTALTGILKY